MFLNWKVADHEALGRMNCKAGSPPMTHLVLTLQDRGAIQPRQHTETDPSSAIHQECSGIRNVRLTVRRVLEALAILSCRTQARIPRARGRRYSASAGLRRCLWLTTRSCPYRTPDEAAARSGPLRSTVHHLRAARVFFSSC